MNRIGINIHKPLWAEAASLDRLPFRTPQLQKAITTKDKTTQSYLNHTKVPKEFMEIKGLSEKIYSSNISIEVYNNRTQIISHRYEQAVVIDNPDIAHVMRQIFEIVWSKT